MTKRRRSKPAKHAELQKILLFLVTKKIQTEKQREQLIKMNGAWKHIFNPYYGIKKYLYTSKFYLQMRIGEAITVILDKSFPGTFCLYEPSMEELEALAYRILGIKKPWKMYKDELLQLVLEAINKELQ